MHGLRLYVSLLVLSLVGGTWATMAMPLCPMRNEASSAAQAPHPCCPKRATGDVSGHHHRAPVKAGGQLAQVACCLVGTVSVLPAGGVSLLQVYDRVAYVAPTVSQPRDPLFEPAIPPPKERFI